MFNIRGAACFINSISSRFDFNLDFRSEKILLRLGSYSLMWDLMSACGDRKAPAIFVIFFTLALFEPENIALKKA